VTAFGRSALHRALAWLLALLLPLQGAAAGVAAASGPAHVHRPTAGAHLVLDDLRRSVPTVARHVHLATLGQHAHSGSDVARHHHAAGDTSVVPLPDDLLNLLAQASQGDDAAAGAALGALLAVLPDGLHWAALPLEHAAAIAPPQAWRSHVPEPDERPPRRV
jgi:hypothetical protein